MELHCTFGIVKYTFYTDRGNESGYTCRVRKITYDPSLKTIVINGNHQDLLINSDVLGISFDKVELKAIPFGITKIFPNLVYFQIRRCGLKTLTKKDLIGLEHLKGLWLPENDIVTLNDGTFDNLQGLKYLCFRNNKLKFIGNNIFKPLKNLYEANFEGNTCINKLYTKGNKDQLNELIEEIMFKCTADSNDISDSQLHYITLQKEIKQLKDHIIKLENKVKILEEEKEANSCIISRLDILQEEMSVMQNRMSKIEDF